MSKDLNGNTLPKGIYQRESGVYRGRFKYKGEQYTLDDANLKTLQKRMADLRYEVEHGLKGKGDNVALNEWFDTWLNVHKKRTIKESTQVRYQDAYRRYIKPSLGKKRIADLNPLVIEKLLQGMADEDYSTKTIQDVYNLINAMVKYAVHNRLIIFNVCAGVEVPKTKKKEIRVLTLDEQQEVLKYAENRLHRNLIHVALGTGMRAGDDDDKIRLNQRKPSKYKGLRRFGPEKNLQRINRFMKERPIFYKNLIQMKENIRFYLRCFYCITKVVILQFNSENRTELARNG